MVQICASLVHHTEPEMRVVLEYANASTFGTFGEANVGHFQNIGERNPYCSEFGTNHGCHSDHTRRLARGPKNADGGINAIP